MNKRIIVLRRADMTDDDIARFLAKIDKGDDCWEWTAAASRNGYGAMGFHGKRYYGGLYSDVHEAEKAAVGLRCKLMTNNLLDRKK